MVCMLCISMCRRTRTTLFPSASECKHRNSGRSLIAALRLTARVAVMHCSLRPSCPTRATVPTHGFTEAARFRKSPSSRDGHACHATDPALMQDIIIGGAVASAVSAAFVNGLKQEPEVCPSCAGTGGVKCFACDGSGKFSTAVKLTDGPDGPSRDVFGRNINKRECTACKGAGLLFCKRCGGSGYTTNRSE